MENWLNRTELLIGKECLDKLKNSYVAVFGCGGVGSYVVEGLVRAGIGHIIVVDNDIIDVTNINRQLIADVTNVGSIKVDAVKKRALLINPNLDIVTYQDFADSSNISKFIPSNCSYIVDAIDTVSSKIDLVCYANLNNIPIISSMGTGNKLDPKMFEVSDISKTSVCPLAKVMRKKLKERGIYHLKVVYSKEIPSRFNNDETLKRTPASISFVPSVCGLIIAGQVVCDIIK